MHCAYPLPGHGFTAPQRAFSVDTKVLGDLAVRLNQGGCAEGEAARSLVADLKRCSGVTLQDNIYAQVAQRVARETDSRRRAARPCLPGLRAGDGAAQDDRGRAVG